MGQKHGRYLSKMNVVLVFLSAKSSGEFMAQCLIRENGELELIEIFINCMLRRTL